MNNWLRAMGLILLALSATACGIFGDKEDEALKPLELTRIETQVNVRRLWSTKIGDSAEFLRIALQPAGDGNRLYAASRNGNVVALDPETGRQQWRTRLDLELSAGPGVGEDLVVVGGSDGWLVALNATTGNELWRVNLAGETLAQPVVKDDVVVVQTIDNRLRGLSAFDGSERWIVEQSIPVLTMRGSAFPVAVGTSVIAGFDNGRLLAANLSNGDIEWEQMLSPPTGRSDLDRLADIDGRIGVVGQDIYAGGYQGNLAALASESGQVLWAREVSTFEGVSADWNNIYTTTPEGEIIAMSRRSGVEAWRQSSLLRREPTLPVTFRTTVVVGDFEGYLHFFSNFDGDPVARIRFGGAAISADPVVVGDRLFVQSDGGSVAAFAIPEPPAERQAPAAAEDGA